MGPYHGVDGRCGLGFCWDSWISVGEDGDDEKEKGREGGREGGGFSFYLTFLELEGFLSSTVSLSLSLSIIFLFFSF